MKKIAYLLLLLVNTQLMYAQSKLAATWQGKLTAGNMTMRIVFHIKDEGNGKLSGTTDSPDQGVTGIECQSVEAKGDSLIINMGETQADYRGKLQDDSTITGRFQQRGIPFPMDLKK